MSKTFTAQLKDIRDLTVGGMEYVMRQSISDVLVGAQTTQIGITQGATSFVEGAIPVGLTAELVNSLTVDGSEGADSYVVKIADMEIGDTMSFAWVAPYAHRIEAGFIGTDELGRTYNVPGRHFVGKNAAKFSDHVEARAAEVRR
ncbi:hypothetical protein A8B82_21090 [Sulfitobacter sp. EhC04]|uniref:hypothetical protein n=1 Tax=Sulfitobacter sp. EhC04 TaxID=1849168 RepID=UPI0007F35342|nr:hypothetical protein [Sulfitobacter sp. EhC04]OAN71092.1 hypothetical protein A8B82_21090 [Sulfitobacter sp. EhC04]